MNTRPTVSRRARIITYTILVLMALTFVVEATDVDASVTAPTATAQSADQPDAATCYPTAWKHKYGNLIWTKIFGVTGYEVTIDYEYRYNGCQVYVVWRDCEVNWAVGWNVSDIKCQHWGNRDNTRLTIQMNYTACLLAQGGPVCGSGWAKRIFGVKGGIIDTEGSFVF